MHQVTAILGSTNTGKTWYALERMQGYARGMIGFPLRLLARENYDRLVEKHGRSAVALITGEEKIIPPHARFYCCTVEAMPVSEMFEFVAIDEIQLCADPDRGHIFTDRLLHCRGTKETLFLGADTMTAIIRQLVDDVHFESRPRLSTLSYTGFSKLTRLPKRSAIVAFNIDDVYAIADVMKRQKGGVAIVMGALSPRTRNAQVDLYQSGEVDYIIATDAIGMGLNMDIRHVALAATRKFDGKHMRSLRADEMAQIVGRAGRHTRDGSFGVTGRLRDLDDERVAAIEHHRFDPIEGIYWRNRALNFDTPKMLLKSLEEKSGHALLSRGRMADDVMALSDMMTRDDVMARATNPAAVRLLWEVCQIPDFRKILSDDHHEFAARIFQLIEQDGYIPTQWMHDRIQRFDNESGDVDTLMTRLGHIRTWTYLTHKGEWIESPTMWQARTREIEDKLSDALHQALIKRFVDQRQTLFSAALDGEKEILAGVRKNGEVIVEGKQIGHLVGFRFIPEEGLLAATGQRTKKILNAAHRALQPEVTRRLTHMVNWNMIGSDQGRFTLHEDGCITWQADATNPLPGDAVAQIHKGQTILTPEVKIKSADMLDDAQKATAIAAIQKWLQSHIGTVLAPLMKLVDENDNKLEGAAKGIGFQLYENLGVIHRSDIENLVPDLTPELRASLRQKRVKMGAILVFMFELVKPAAINLRALLWGLWHDRALPMDRPADGRVSIMVDPKAIDRNYFRSIGYPVFGALAIRIDMLDRVVTDIYDSAKDYKFQAKQSYMEWLGCGEEDLYAVLQSMGFRKYHAPEEDKIGVAHPPQPLQEGSESEDGQAQETPQKTELATFILKKGKISDRPRPKRADNDKKSSKKPHKKAPKDKNKAKSYSFDVKGGGDDDDSPFAVLKQLQK